ncbi:hypothetical protein M3P19_07935 [Muricauda sp. 2012CJ35-5]|uniref:C-type lysozyme inhibitor domain-containing protein n=1 Tax=Flagellimonas spongiicola TaxID=2942208 RepID=A0ABT0PRG1_9FLAO|nr:hypothetical protein [Allomuricauda spongiicola]MCL6273934.1 hypothetical protein [Allomuricauda spongiicola]
MRYVLIILSLFLVTSCSSDNAINPGNDVWVLQNVSCFCYFGEDYDFSQHTIQFDSSTKQVTFSHNGELEFLVPAGTYPYTDNGTEIGIEGRQYLYREEGDLLVLNYVDNPQIADDEVTYSFQRN